MLTLFVVVILVLAVSSVFGVCVLISVKAEMSREKLVGYECGFDSVLSARSAFSLRFFLLGVLFVIFDVEVVLMLPMVFLLSCKFSLFGVVSGLFFLYILLLGVFHEWREGSLEWVVVV